MDLLWEIVFGLIGLLVAGAVGFLYHAGYFYKVNVSVGAPIISNVEVAYKFHVGHYSACGPHFEELVQLCPELRCLGIFYDDPKEVDPNSCRYIVAVVVAEGDVKADSNVMKTLKESGFKFSNFPNVPYAVKTTHLFTMNLSAYFGATKAYPAMEKYVKEEKLSAHPYLEIYEDKLIHYMGPLSKHEEFYVDEVKEMLKREE